MTTSINLAAIGLAILPSALWAQWPSYKDGRTSLTAPAPKTSDGHPDLSGIWDRGMAPMPEQQGAPGAPPGGFGAPPAPEHQPRNIVQTPGLILIAQAVDGQLNQRLMPDTELTEFICSENNRSLEHLVGK